MVVLRPFLCVIEGPSRPLAVFRSASGAYYAFRALLALRAPSNFTEKYSSLYFSVAVHVRQVRSLTPRLLGVVAKLRQNPGLAGGQQETSRQWDWVQLLVCFSFSLAAVPTERSPTLLRVVARRLPPAAQRPIMALRPVAMARLRPTLAPVATRPDRTVEVPLP